MGCASSKDIDEVEKRKGKKGSQSEKPFDRPGIKYIDENTSKQPIDDKVTPRDAELELNEDSKGQDVNGVQSDDPNELKVTATTEEGEVAVSQKELKEGPAADEIKVTATTEEGEVHIPQDTHNVDTSKTSVSDTQVEGSSVENALHSNQVPDAIQEYAEQLADEVQKDSIRQLEREAAEEQPQGLPDPAEPEGSSVDALPGEGLQAVAPDGSTIDKKIEDVVKASDAPQEPAEVKLKASSDQSQAQDAVKQAMYAAPAPDSGNSYNHGIKM